MKGIALFFIAVFIGLCIYAVNECDIKETSYIVTVKSKEAVSTKESHYYLIYCKEGVFKVDDNMFKGVFNSSDTYNEIEPGRSYLVTCTGFRNNFWSMYPNIIKIKSND